MNHSLSIVAQKQLAAWRRYAEDWEVYANDEHVRCAECHQSIIRLADRNGTRYEYSAEDQWAMLVAHLRQNHPDVERDVYGNDSSDDQTGGASDSDSGDIPRYRDSLADRGLPD